MSYYKQAGVASGLIRSINQGLSDRVKYSQEFANTRLNNDEFKGANRIAKFAFNSVLRRRSSMMRRFAIAEMTKAALSYIKDGRGNWGLRLPNTPFDQIVSSLLERHAKLGVYDGQFGVLNGSIDDNDKIIINYGLDSVTANELKNSGIDQLQFYLSFSIGNVEVIIPEGSTIGSIGVVSGSSMPDGEEIEIDTASGNSFTNEHTPSAAFFGLPVSAYSGLLGTETYGIFANITIVPSREVNSVYYPLVENATYVSIPLGQLSE